MTNISIGSLVPAAAVNFFYYALIGGVISYLAVLLSSRGFSSSEVGSVIATYTFVRIFSGQLWAYLADKQQNPKLYFQLAIGIALVAMVPSLVFNIKWVTWGSLVVSFVFFMSAISQIEVLSMAATHDNPTLYNRVRLFGSIGFIVAAVVIGSVIEQFGVKYVLPYGVSVLVVILALSFKLKNGQRHQIAGNTNSSDFLKRCLNSGFIVFMLASILLQMSFAPYVGFFTQYLSINDYSGTTTGLLFALGTFSEVFMFLVAGHILARFRLKTLMVICLLLTAVRWALVAYFTDVISVVIISQLLHAVSFGLMHSASIYFIRGFFPSYLQNQGQFMYLGLTFGLGGALGAWLTGITWHEGAGGEFTFLWATVAVACAGLMILMTPYKKFQFAADKVAL